MTELVSWNADESEVFADLSVPDPLVGVTSLNDPTIINRLGPSVVALALPPKPEGRSAAGQPMYWLDPEDARELAAQLLITAEAADSGSLLFEVMKRCGMPAAEALMLAEEIQLRRREKADEA